MKHWHSAAKLGILAAFVRYLHVLPSLVSEKEAEMGRIRHLVAMVSKHTISGLIFVFVLVISLSAQPRTSRIAATGAGSPLGDYSITNSIVHEGEFDEEIFAHSRAALIPGPQPLLVLTTQKKITRGVDAFYSRYECTSRDMGQTWTDLVEIPATRRAVIDPAGDRAYADSTPQWHAASGIVLSIGVIIPYGMRNPRGAGRTDPEPVFPDFSRPRKTAYMVRHPAGRWGPVRRLDLPADFPAYHAPSSCQRVDLANGHILQPLHCQPGQDVKHVRVLELRFDGDRLEYLRQGNEIRLPGSGKAVWLAEPSLVRFQDQYLLTIRNAKAAFVAHSKDGLHFDRPRRWCWDNGEVLDSYATQQHWLRLGGKLFLVYTRCGPASKGIFNSRAPLYLAQVDPQRLCVIRSTERVLFPNQGYPLGNFGITEISNAEALVFTTEWPRIEFDQLMRDRGNDILMAHIKSR